MQETISLSCSECKRKNYTTTKNKKTNTEKNKRTNKFLTFSVLSVFSVVQELEVELAFQTLATGQS